MNVKKQVFCNNCGKLGHLFHNCRVPITSIGIIPLRIVKKFNNALKHDENVIELLIIKRKDSLAFIDFMRGKYIMEDKKYILNLLNNMSVGERNYLIENDFSAIWNYLWNYNTNNLYRNEERLSKIKFNKLKSGYVSVLESYNLKDLINLCDKKYLEPEWGFPKGRRNYHEKDILCGLREFEEETGYKKTDIEIFNNIMPFEEIFTGSNYKSYKHKYFVGIINNNTIPKNTFQINEISEIRWVPIDDVCKFIRDYNYEKTNIINDLNKLLKTYKLYI
uniref:Nudix hydrolase domain-containing protein n=1 Tax=viral metagenome TaxID=1070528 RepID=A0A6C0E0R0_9ZZZZ